MYRRVKISVIIITAFSVWLFLWKNPYVFSAGDRFLSWAASYFPGLEYVARAARSGLNFALLGLIPLAALFVIHKPGEIVRSVGLSRSFPVAAIMALVCMGPLFAGYAFAGCLNEGVTADEFFRHVLVAGFFEELVFRGFLFGQLFRYAGWGFVPSVLASSLPFGFLHMLYGFSAYSWELATMTALDGIFFCWVYAEWKYNLWCAIGLHALLNLTGLFFMPDYVRFADAAMWINLSWFGCILWTVLITFFVKKHFSEPYQVRPGTLFFRRVVVGERDSAR